MNLSHFKTYFAGLVFFSYLMISNTQIITANQHQASCGDTFLASQGDVCQCPGVPASGVLLRRNSMSADTQCCGTVNGNSCLDPHNPVPTPNVTEAPSTVTEPLNEDTFRSLNPLVQESSNARDGHALIGPGGSLNVAGTINRLLEFLFPLAGMILFVMLIWGGFEMLTGAANKQSLDAGKQRITAALIGFILLFSSYWFIQIIQAITGVSILN